MESASVEKVKFDIESVDKLKLVNDFEYFFQAFQWVDSNNTIPFEIRSSYMEGFFKFSKQLPTMNQPIPTWTPELKPKKVGLAGVFQDLSDFFT
jgi:hypothetical protein